MLHLFREKVPVGYALIGNPQAAVWTMRRRCGGDTRPILIAAWPEASNYTAHSYSSSSLRRTNTHKVPDLLTGEFVAETTDESGQPLGSRYVVAVARVRTGLDRDGDLTRP